MMPQQDAPTLGWDLVYAVRTDCLNQKLAQCIQPVRFEGHDDGTKVTGVIDNWKIVTGGSGAVLYLELTVSDAHVNDEKTDTSFNGSVVVDAQLAWFTKTYSASLGICTMVNSGSPVRSPLTILSSDFVPDMALRHVAVVETVLQDWLRQQTGLFAQVLAQIDMSPIESTQAHSWLKPSHVSYAYTDIPGRNEGLLAVLAMTNSREAPVLNSQVMATALAPDSPAALLISPHLMLDWIIRPALEKTFHVANPAVMILEDEPPRLYLPKPVSIPDIRDGDSLWPASLTKLVIRFTGNELQCESEVCIDKQALFDYTTVSSRHVLTTETDACGKLRVLFIEACPPEVHQSTQLKDEFIREMHSEAMAVLLIGTAVAFMLTGPLSLSIMLLSCTVSGLIECIPAVEYYCDRTEPHPFDLLCLNVSQPFSWHGGEQFSLASVSLVQSLRLEGSPWSDPL